MSEREREGEHVDFQLRGTMMVKADVFHLCPAVRMGGCLSFLIS